MLFLIIQNYAHIEIVRERERERVKESTRLGVMLPERTHCRQHKSCKVLRKKKANENELFEQMPTNVTNDRHSSADPACRRHSWAIPNVCERGAGKTVATDPYPRSPLRCSECWHFLHESQCGRWHPPKAGASSHVDEEPGCFPNGERNRASDFMSSYTLIYGFTRTND